MKPAYYNEIDPYAVQWLKNLIKAGHIPAGDVDDRSIIDVAPADLRGYGQCHFFAGIAVWSYSLRLARWPENKPVWTGSCPCQPFSVAGKRGGFTDERHLWPAWFKLISECRPGVVFGEQVASKDAVAWIDAVFNDLEEAGYACGAVDLPACGAGAPHIRQRHFWVADADDSERWADCSGRDNRHWTDAGRAQDSGHTEGRSCAGGMADTDGRDAGTEGIQRGGQHGQRQEDSIVGDGSGWSGPVNGLWRNADWLRCTDGRWRPVESGTFPLAHGVANRMGKLRAYGNAINAEAAAEVIAAYMAVRP